jgi:hypothetical protein
MSCYLIVPPDWLTRIVIWPYLESWSDAWPDQLKDVYEPLVVWT